MEECFNAKWKIYSENAVDIIFFSILKAQMGKIVTLTAFLWIICFSNIWGNGKTQKYRKTGAVDPKPPSKIVNRYFILIAKLCSALVAHFAFVWNSFQTE